MIPAKWIGLLRNILPYSSNCARISFGAWKARLGPSDKSDNDNDALVDFAVTVLPQERHSIVGAFVDAGANPLISQKHLAQGVQKEKGDFFPAVASDGERFLAVWNRKYVYLNTTGTPLWNITSQIVSRLFDQDGNPVSNEQVLTQTPYVSTATQEYAADGAAFWNWDQAYRRIKHRHDSQRRVDRRSVPGDMVTRKSYLLKPLNGEQSGVFLMMPGRLRVMWHGMRLIAAIPHSWPTNRTTGLFLSPTAIPAMYSQACSSTGTPPQPLPHASPWCSQVVRVGLSEVRSLTILLPMGLCSPTKIHGMVCSTIVC